MVCVAANVEFASEVCLCPPWLHYSVECERISCRYLAQIVGRFTGILRAKAALRQVFHN